MKIRRVFENKIQKEIDMFEIDMFSRMLIKL